MKNKKETENAALADLLDELDVDLHGVVSLDDIEGSSLAQAARSLLPGVSSIIVLGMEIYAEFLDLTVTTRTAGAPAMNDMLVKHQDFLRSRLTRAAYILARASRAQGKTALPLSAEGPSVDRRFLRSIIPFKEAAAAAGLGEVGMSSLLLTPEYGPRVLLNLCLTEAKLSSTKKENSRVCRYCNVCVFRCPAKALGYPRRDKGEKFVINRFACQQYVTGAGGCSECMRVCPIASPKYNK